MQYVASIIGFVAGTYVLVCLFAFVFQEKLAYFPDRVLAATPATFGIEYEESRFATADGRSIHGWFIPCAAGAAGPDAGGPADRGDGGTSPDPETSDARLTVLYCHGNAGNISHRLHLIEEFGALGVDLLLFDYRGYGQSDGRPSERGTYLDADAAWRYLTEQRGVSPGNIVIAGRSLGGAVAAELATRQPAAGLVLDSAFTSLPDLGRVAYPWLPVRLLARMQYSTLERVRQLACPKLVVHSTDDEVVPYRMGRALFEAAGTPKWFLPIRGSHNRGSLVGDSAYMQAWRDFLASLRSGRPNRSFP